MPKSRAILICIISSLFAQEGAASIIIKGNSENLESTFNFAINKYVKSERHNVLYVGAAATEGSQGRANSFALSALLKDAATFIPFAPEKMTVNITQVGQQNPLFDAGIRELALLENSVQGLELPALITQEQPNRLYLYESTIPEALSLLQSAPMRDTNNVIGDQLFGLATDGEAHLFSMIKPQNTIFGQPGTGIVGVIRGTINTDTQLRVFQQIDLPTGAIVGSPVLRALPLDVSSLELKIGPNNLASIAEVVSLHWDSILQRLFIGLQVITNNTSGSGARSVVVGRLEGNKMLLTPIAPDTVFDQLDDGIVGALNSADVTNTAVSVHALKTMHTSTGLTYLLVHGGNGLPENTQQMVYALPLVSTKNNSLTGTVASSNAEPQTIFVPGPTGISYFSQRNFTQAAQTADELARAGQLPVLVGADIVRAGSITNLIVMGDTVFATVVNESDSTRSGIYYSYALFEANGAIKGWSNWQRAGGNDEPIFGAVLNANDASFSLVTQDTNAIVNTVKRTQWGRGNAQGLMPLVDDIDAFFPSQQGGITSATNFGSATPGLGASTLLVLGGDKQLMLVQTGLVNEGVIIPHEGAVFNNRQTFENGTITQQINSAVVAITGGVIDTLGPLTAAEIVVDQQHNQAWLVIAGTNGVAILSNPDGTGWDATEGIGDNLVNIQEGMSFKMIGNYYGTQKIIADNGFMYLLTSTQLDRISTAQSSFGLGLATPVILTTIAALGLPVTGGFFDAIISGPLALLATTNGLFRVADNYSIRADLIQPLAWTLLPVAESLPSITQLVAMTLTGRAQDAAQSAGVPSHVYVLCGYEGRDQATVNRFAIKSLIDQDYVSASTVRPFNDVVVQTIASNFFNFGRFEKNVITDGALFFTTSDKNGISPATLGLIPFMPQPQVGRPALGLSVMPIVVDGTQNATILQSLQRNSASGSWLLSGNFGLRVNE